MFDDVVVRAMGYVEYTSAWRAMQDFTRSRDASTTDEIWLLEHPPVYTVGLKGKRRELAGPEGVPFVRSDRGGDITYHGPGQAIVYVLMDLQRRRWGVKQLVSSLEQTVIDLLDMHGVRGRRRVGAPGVYVENGKIAALGLRVRRGCSYHGLALNVDMDLRPFTRIDPCGYPGLAVTQLIELGVHLAVARVNQLLVAQLARNLRYRLAHTVTEQGEIPSSRCSHG
ncbi:MAG: lipoyl(octanoyl) transferase LipB [Acidiferrobacterales bacterium]